MSSIFADQQRPHYASPNAGEGGVEGSQHKVRTYKEYHSVCPSSELGLHPTPHPQASVPLPPVSGGRGTLAGEKGVGRVPIPTKGIHCGTLYMYVLCGSQPVSTAVHIT